MKNFLNSESNILENFIESIQDQFYKLRFGIKRCARPTCTELDKIRYELLEWCRNQDNWVDEDITIPATVNAGLDQTKQLPTNTGILTGTYQQGTNPIVSQLWTRVSGPSITFTNPTLLSTAYTATTAGSYIIKLTITDNKDLTYSDQLTININSAIQRVYYGFKSTNASLTESQILASTYININPGQSNYNLPLQVATTPSYVWFAEQTAQPLKTKWQDTIVSFNNGFIGTDQDLFGAYSTVGNYRFTQTEYITQFDYPINIKTT